MTNVKTPGSHAPVVSGGNNQVLVIGAAERDELVRLRREALDAMEPKPISLLRQMAQQAILVIRREATSKILAQKYNGENRVG